MESDLRILGDSEGEISDKVLKAVEEANTQSAVPKLVIKMLRNQLSAQERLKYIAIIDVWTGFKFDEVDLGVLSGVQGDDLSQYISGTRPGLISTANAGGSGLRYDPLGALDTLYPRTESAETLSPSYSRRYEAPQDHAESSIYGFSAGEVQR